MTHPEIYNPGNSDPLTQLESLRDLIEASDDPAVINEIDLVLNGLAGSLAAASEPELTAESNGLSPERRAARRDQIVSNYLRHYGPGGSDGASIEDFTPLDHQPRIFRALGEAMAKGPDDDGSIKIGMRAAPNVGKGVILPVCARAMGIGEPTIEGEPPLSGLYLVPDLNTLYQVAEDEERGFMNFAPEIDLGTYYSFAKDIADMTVMTDKSLIMLSDEKFMEVFERVDVIFIDEAHRAYGPQIQARIKELMPGRVIIGASATTDLNAKRNLETELGISNMAVNIGFREAIEDKIANGAQILALSTRSHLEVSHSDGPTEADLVPLAHDKDRNALIVETLQYATESGRPGLTRCIWGNSSWHARAIAEAASKITITDPDSGEQRLMRVKAVGSFQSRNENKAVIDAFSRGEIDQITFSKYLIEGYDEKRVSFVFNTQPTSSIADVDQLFGRGMRFNDQLTLYVELIDSYSGRGKPIYSFFDTVEEDMVQQGLTIGDTRRNRVSTSDPRTDERRNQPDDNTLRNLPMRLREAAEAINGRVVRELMVVGLEFEDPPADWQPVSELPINNRLTPRSVLWALRRQGIPLKQKSRGVWYGPPDLAERAAEVDFDIEEGDLIPWSAFLAQTNLGRDRALALLRQLKLPINTRRHPKTRKPVRYVTEVVRDIIREYVEEHNRPFDEQRDLRLSTVAIEAGRNLNSVRLVTGELGVTLYTRYAGGSPVLCIDRDENERVLEALKNRRYIRDRPRKRQAPPNEPATQTPPTPEADTSHWLAIPSVVPLTTEADKLLFQGWMNTYPDAAKLTVDEERTRIAPEGLQAFLSYRQSKVPRR